MKRTCISSKRLVQFYVSNRESPVFNFLEDHSHLEDWTKGVMPILQFKGKGHSFEDDKLHVVDGEDGWFARVVKAAFT